MAVTCVCQCGAEGVHRRDRHRREWHHRVQRVPRDDGQEEPQCS